MEGMKALHLFEGYGIELEYMIVDRRTLSVLPAADRLLRAQAGETVDEVAVGPLCWSNELALHVVELKTNGPVPTLAGLAAVFTEQIGEINRLLEPLGGMLMPSAMHPWMDPSRETRLWPHDHGEIYRTYNRIFDCRGHGWANLQSVHLNLPFADDLEFARLHAAIRLVLPILPALAASSPVMEGKVTGLLDNRLEVYRVNQKRIPAASGRIIPEPAYSRQAYQKRILDPLYAQIAPFDPEGVLQYEWLNSRGAIARFERSTIEIRLLDVQESPRADLAIAALIAATIKALVEERWCSLAEQQRWEEEELLPILLGTIRAGEETVIENSRFLRGFGFTGQRCTAGDLLRHLADHFRMGTPSGGALEEEAALEIILERGPLARRLVRALGENPSPERFRSVYRRLCTCLARGEMFLEGSIHRQL